MIELGDSTEGTLGDGVWFSDIFYSAAKSRFTGGVLVQSDEGDRTIFFREGSPVYAGGAGFATHHIGDLLIKAGQCDQDALAKALQEQQALGEGGPLLGTLLVANAHVNPDEIKRAVRQQVSLRLALVMSQNSGTFRAAAGESPRIREIGIKTDTWPIFFSLVVRNAADGEMKAISRDLLGHSVRAKASAIPDDFEAIGDAKRVLHYLEKPRKPDQLERALKNRKLVRGLLRALSLAGALEKLPVKKGIPIPKATLLKGQRGISTAELEPQPRASTPAPRRSSSVSKPKKPHPIVKEVDKLHAELKEKNHFEKLGATEKSTAAELRSLFTALAKKYHPDAFPNEVPEETKIKAREISATFNEAYQTLSSEEKRAEYLALLHDDRIKGDARKAELIRDAEVKNKMGVVMLRKREYQKAREFFKYSTEADPSSGEYKANLAWSMYADPAMDREEAIEQAYALLLEALKSSQPSAQIHYYTGQVLKAQEKIPEATHHFGEALRLDRDHKEAGRELRLLKMRNKKQIEEDRNKKGGSALSRLFKRS